MRGNFKLLRIRTVLGPFRTRPRKHTTYPLRQTRGPSRSGYDRLLSDASLACILAAVAHVPAVVASRQIASISRSRVALSLKEFTQFLRVMRVNNKSFMNIYISVGALSLLVRIILPEHVEHTRALWSFDVLFSRGVFKI